VTFCFSKAVINQGNTLFVCSLMGGAMSYTKSWCNWGASSKQAKWSELLTVITKISG